MKKTNKKLSLKAETVRTLSEQEMAKVAGAVPPNSQLGSGCLSCGCNSKVQTECYSCFPCVTAYGQTCATTC